MAFPDGWLHIKNWEKYQSSATKSRGPWIKLWHTLFSDNQFMSLPRATRYDWIAILSLSGHQTHTGWIPNCSKTVTRLIQGCRSLDLQVFEKIGFLEKSCATDKSRVEESRVEKKVLIAPEAAQPAPVSPKPVFTKPTIEEVQKYMHEQGFKDSISKGQHFFDYYEARGWIPGGSRTQMKSWKAAVRTWKKNDDQRSGNGKTAYDPSRDRLSPWN